MTEGPAPKRAKTDASGVLGEEAIQFRISRPDCHGQATQDTFRPLMTHQLLGEEEMLHGYRNPEMTVHMNLDTYEVSPSFRHDGEAGKGTNIEQLMADAFKGAVVRQLKDLQDSRTQPLAGSAEHLGVEIGKSETPADMQTSIHWTNLSKSHEVLKSIHSRAQLLLPFFIDGATSIDQADANWELFTAVRTINGVCCMVGFCTAYRVYAYSESSRLRVSQLLVLPPFQRQGIGRKLLEAVYNRADTEDLQDIIYEDPTEDVEVLRERIELERCKRCEWLVKLAAEQQQAFTALNGHAGGQPLSSVALPPEQAKQAQKELRLTKQQVQKAWEVLLAEQEVFQKEPAASVLRGLIARRLLGKFSDTEKQAVGKRIFNLDNQWGESYIMHKVPNFTGQQGVPVAMDDKQEKGQSKEEREQAWEEAIEARWHFIADLAGFV